MKKTIKLHLLEGLNSEIISDHEYSELCPSDKGAGKFYELFKVHKEHDPPNLPPEIL